MCSIISLHAPFVDHRSTLDSTDKVSGRELAVAQDEKDHDRDLRDYETSSREIKYRDIAIAIQLQHADRDREIRLMVEEDQAKDKFLPDSDKVERVADNNSGHR
jgi:hypothetical protein